MYQRIKITYKIFIIITFIFVLLPLMALLYMNFVQEYPRMVNECAMLKYMHLYCPGCGGTRAVKALLHFHILESLLCNPLVVYTVAVILYYWIKSFVLLIKNRGIAVFDMYLGWLWGEIIIIVGLFVIRNILLCVWGIDYLGNLKAYWQ